MSRPTTRASAARLRGLAVAALGVPVLAAPGTDDALRRFADGAEAVCAESRAGSCGGPPSPAVRGTVTRS